MALIKLLLAEFSIQHRTEGFYDAKNGCKMRIQLNPDLFWPDPAPVKKDIETPTENQHSSLFIIVKLYVEVRNHVIQYIVL